MTTRAIEVRRVSKEFERHRQIPSSLRERLTRRPRAAREAFWALQDVDLAIEQGASFALVGDNGSGKSTLLKIIAGIHRPTSGTVKTAGRLSALLELGAGFHPDLTGRDNVFLNGTILGLSRRELEARFDAIVDFSGIEEFIDTPIKFYSSGMHLRLAFAVAINVDPDILLVDEILAVGDLEFQRKCMEHLYRVRRNGTTVVLVSHNLATLRDMCDHGMWLDKGRPMLVGGMHEVTEAYVAEVNARAAEVARINRDSGVLELESGTVLGSGETRVVSVELLNGDTPVAAGLTGEPLTIRLNVRTATAIPAADVTLTIHHESGAAVAQLVSSGNRSPMRFPAGSSHVDYTMPECLLAPGRFELSVAISHQGHAFDWRERRYGFPVYTAGGDVGGLVQLPGRWEIGSDDVEGLPS